jgi:hypothetical protein
MYEMPPPMDHTSKGQPLAKVSSIKGFFQSCVKLLNDPSSIKVLQNLLEICNTEVEGKLEEEIEHKNIRTRRLAEKASSHNSQHCIHLNDTNI